jgi:hypothetical protein
MIAKTLSTSQRYARLHQVAGKLAEFCQALYPLLVSHSDDSGRQQGDVFTVKHAVCPSSPRTIADVEKALTALHQVGLITCYEVAQRKYIEIQDFASHQPGLKNRDNSKIPPVPPNAAGCREMPSEGKGTEEKRTEQKGREENGADAPSATLASVSDVPNDPDAPNCKVEAFVQLWNETVTAPIAQCRGLSDQRREKIRLRLKERSMGEWLAAFQRIEASAFCHGTNDRGWVMSIDWLIRNNDHVMRVLEGKYDDKASRKPAERGARPQPATGCRYGHQPPCLSSTECTAKMLAEAKAEAS